MLALGLGAIDANGGGWAAPPVPGAQVADGSGLSETGLRAVSAAHTLAPISAHELMRGSSPDLGGRHGSAAQRGTTLHFDGGINPPPLATLIRREIAGVWRFVPSPEQLRQHTLPQVRVEMRSARGRLGELTLRDRPDVSVPVTVQADQVLRQGMRGEAWYEGSVVIEIPVAELTAAGTYGGRIEVNLESF